MTDDEALADKLRVLRLHGSKPKYYNSMIGGNFRLDPIQAAVLSVKLPHLDSWHAGRQENAAYYDDKLKGVGTPKAVWGRQAHIYNQYVLSVDTKRDALMKHLKDNGIGCEIYYPVTFHEQECFRYLGYELGAFPASEKAARSTLAIPIYPDLTTEMQDYVISKVHEFLRG